MITSLEIAKILSDQKRKKKSANGGFDTALQNLGVHADKSAKKA